MATGIPFDVDFIYAAIGGRDRFKKLLTFAEEHAPDEVLDAFNAAVESENTEQILAYLTRFATNYAQINGHNA